MLHKVMDPAGPASQMPLQARAHHTPSKPWPIARGDVCILHTDDALLDEIEDLSVERRLKPVPNMARESLAQPDRLLADRRIERHGSFDHRLGRLRPAYYFNQGHKMGGIKGMPYHAALGMLTARLNDIHGDAGCARSEDRLRRSGFVHLGEDFGFQEGSFRDVLLNKVGLRHRLLHVGSEGQSVAACTRS